MPSLPRTYQSATALPVGQTGSDVTTTINPTEYPTALDTTGAISLAAYNNTGANFTGPTFSGTWFITEQELEVEYVRKPHGSRTVGSRSDIDLSAMSVSADTDSSVFFKVRPIVRKYILDETFMSSGYEQLQTFSHTQASADLGGTTFDGMTSATLGVRGKITTAQKYLKREAYDPADATHVPTDYIYPWFYSYDVGNPAMLIPFFAAQQWNQQLFNDGGTAYAVAQESVENDEVYDAIFTEVDSDFAMFPGWWLGTKAADALEGGGGVANYRNSYLYSPVQGIPAVSFMQNFSFDNEISPSTLLTEVWKRWTTYQLHETYRSPGLNLWDIGTNAYTIECVGLQANMPSQPATESKINSWLQALPYEYQIVRHA